MKQRDSSQEFWPSGRSLSFPYKIPLFLPRCIPVVASMVSAPYHFARNRKQDFTLRCRSVPLLIASAVFMCFIRQSWYFASMEIAVLVAVCYQHFDAVTNQATKYFWTTASQYSVFDEMIAKKNTESGKGVDGGLNPVNGNDGAFGLYGSENLKTE